MPTYYDPSQDTSSAPRIGIGLYPAHITDVKRKIISFSRGKKDKKKFKAEIINLILTVAPEVAGTTISLIDHNGVEATIDGSKYIGREIRHKGIFRFIEPTALDEFLANPGGNGEYMTLCDVVGAVPKSVKIEDENGEEKEVFEMPVLDDKDLLNKPVIVETGNGKPYTNKYGETVSYVEGKKLTGWKNGKTLEAEVEEELPF